MSEIKGVLSVIKKNKLLFLLGGLGLLLLLFGSTLTKSEGAKEKEAPVDLCTAYREELEASLASACAEIRGVGRTKVVLTLATTEIAVYEKNYTGENETVASAGGDALLLAYRMPEITGVAVLCEGGDDIIVKEELYSFFRAVLGLTTREIHISPLK